MRTGDDQHRNLSDTEVTPGGVRHWGLFAWGLFAWGLFAWGLFAWGLFVATGHTSVTMPTRASTDASSCARSIHSSAVCAWAIEPGPHTIEGTPAAA